MFFVRNVMDHKVQSCLPKTSHLCIKQPLTSRVILFIIIVYQTVRKQWRYLIQTAFCRCFYRYTLHLYMAGILCPHMLLSRFLFLICQPHLKVESAPWCAPLRALFANLAEKQTNGLQTQSKDGKGTFCVRLIHFFKRVTK